MKFYEIVEKTHIKKLTFWVLVVFVVVRAVSSGYFYLQTHASLNTHYGAVLSMVKEYKSTLIAKSFTINIVFFVLIVAGIVVLGILYSHRIAGPLYRIKQYAKQISGGELNTHVGFRIKDVIHPFSESVNELTSSYNFRLTSLASRTEELKKAVAEFESLAVEGKDVEDALQKIIEADSEIRKLLESVKV